jgi:histidinol dehydrogenase
VSIALRTLRTDAADFEAQFERLRHWSPETDAAIESRVAAIVDDVRRRGDAALLEYTARFDRIDAARVADLEIARDELRAAADRITSEQRAALQAAAARIRAYHERQREASSRSWAWRDAEGSLLGQKVTPLERVGIYVPGGKAAYPSSVLMNGIPAQVAGVREIVMAAPMPGGERNALVLAAANLAGATRVFTVGGAQAIAALAYGTATVPRVDKITGPGNAYVTSAKRRVFGQVGIDVIAGPSEILIIADGSTSAEWAAMDLFSQAEHDELAQALLLTPDAAYARAVHEAIERLLPQQPRREVIRASLEGRGALVITRSMHEACAISNRIAPEHLEVCTKDPQRWEPLLEHAGAIFIGAYASESLGDYCAGPNHVLPTAGTARFSSPLGVYDFVKRSSLIEVSATGAQVLGPIADELARGEGLHAHALAARLRVRPGPGTAEPPTSFEVRAVTGANVDQLIKLDVAPDQRELVSGVAKSLAQAAYRPAGRPVALYAAGEPVGLLLLYDARQDSDEPEDRLYVWRLLIDQAHQRRGYGAMAIRWAIDEAARLGVAELVLSHQDLPGHAGPFYEKLGFRYTGKIDDNELEMVYSTLQEPRT